MPIVAVTDADSVPYVLATDIVRVPPGQGFPIEEIAAAVAPAARRGRRRRSPRGCPCSAAAVCEELIRSFSKRNALDRRGGVHPRRRHAGADAQPGRGSCCGSRSPTASSSIAPGRLELLGVVGAGFGLRAVARELLDVVPVAGWAVKGAIAYTGTRAVGEAAVRYFEARADLSAVRSWS